MSREREALDEAARQLNLCNACRYCEGYCAVFPALELRTALTDGTIDYLANLCHDCRACFQACMYTPPHEFALNLPLALSDVRRDTYARYARPAWLAAAFRNPLGVTGISLAVGLVVAVIAASARDGPGAFLSGSAATRSFYSVVPYAAMLAPALALSAYVAMVLAASFGSFWSQTGGTLRELLDVRVTARAWLDAFTLRWQSGGGAGCFYPETDRASQARRHLHVALVMGLLSAFAATIVAAVYQEILGDQPPYSPTSLPVVLGTVGGAAAMVGAGGLLALKIRSDRALGAASIRSLDYAFLLMLEIVAATGLLLLVVRATAAMRFLLVIHLAAVFALYLTVPYGKFVHAVYRLAALHRKAADAR